MRSPDRHLETFDRGPVLDAETLYLGDNGRCFCGEHAGTTAAYTGRDLSGQPVVRLTQEEVDAYHAETGWGGPWECEKPSCDRRVEVSA